MDDHFSANWNNLKKISTVIQVIFLSSFILENKCDRPNQLSHDRRRWLFSLSNGFHVGLMQEGNPQNKVFHLHDTHALVQQYAEMFQTFVNINKHIIILTLCYDAKLYK